MTTISEPAFQAILAKPMQTWTDEEHRAFWCYVDTHPDRNVYWHSLERMHELRIEYLAEHDTDPDWVRSDECLIDERVGFQELLAIDFADDDDFLAFLAGDFCWSQVCSHPVADHDSRHPSAPCRATGCPCLFLVRPERTELVCVCGHTMGQHTHTGCPRCLHGHCQFTAAAATPVAST